MTTTFEDIDLDEVLAGAQINIPATEASYSTYIVKYRKFIKLEKGANIPPTCLTDPLIAKFLHWLGEAHEHKPHHLKSASAALGAELVRHALPGIYKSPHLYTKTALVIRTWHTILKINPYFVEKAEGFSVPAMGHILTLSQASDFDLRDVAVVSVSCFTGLRMQDIERLYERNVLQLPPGTDGAPRCFQLTHEVAKNDRDGTKRTAQDKLCILPCICHIGLTKGEEKKWLKQCNSPAGSKCLGPCPYQLVCQMQARKPKTSTVICKSTGELVKPGDMAFARALCARGNENRVFCSSKCRINELQKMPERINLQLPENLRPKRNGTGHSGRHAYVSGGMNSGATAAVVALGSHHKNPQCLQGYIKPDLKLLAGGALAIGANLKNLSRSDSEEDEVDKENGASSASSVHKKAKAAPASPATPKATKVKARAGTPSAPAAAKVQGTPGAKSKGARKGTPVPAKKSVSWADETEVVDSSETAAKLAAATARNTHCILHEDMRGACVRRGESSSSSSSYQARYKEEEDEEEEEEGADSSKGIHIHLHMTGGGKMKRG
ncbi:hypothetical protein B484DRAFT_394668 [Ochromonadaceae sp. CCMP2298]|nr:hypothetical protein B484DRAFT_394668 [Ochromonadaceae sp. CCMP2298]